MTSLAHVKLGFAPTAASVHRFRNCLAYSITIASPRNDHGAKAIAMSELPRRLICPQVLAEGYPRND